MTFYPVLRDCDDTVFLLHVETDGKRLNAAVLIADPYMNNPWLRMSTHPALQGTVLEVQMPAEIVGQPERYKGYDLNLPFRQS